MSAAPHPLVGALNATLPERARILLLGVGSGRNVPPLLAAGHTIDVLEEDRERALAASRRFAAEPRVRIARTRYAGPIPFSGSYDAALSTHALLHGSPSAIAAALAAIRNRLRPGAPFYLTLGSCSDPRFGRGRRIDEASWMPIEGAEVGVPHVYFDEPAVRRLLVDFVLDSLSEQSAAESAGRWAHTAAQAEQLVHWFVLAKAAAPQ